MAVVEPTTHASTRRSFYFRAGKRVVDIFASVGLILATSPFLILSIVLILIFDRHNPIFKQERIGRDRKVFTLYKLRSMRVSAPNVPSDKASEAWITKIGAFLRRTSMDELPQLWCVLRGDMSMIGYRPGLPAQQELDEMRSARGVYVLRPGMSGLAQVKGYDGMPNDEKADYDATYVRTLTAGLDIWILFQTFAYFFRKPPVY